MTRTPSRRRLLTGALALAGLVLTAAGCGAPGPSGGSQDGTGDGSDGSGGQQAISTDPSKAGEVTLRVWDQEVRGGQNAEITQLNQEFEEKYPNVTIERTAKSFSDLKTTLKLALSGNNPPDVVEVNQGYPDMVSFVKAGMLLPLDDYADAYGWADRYPSSLLDLNRVSEDASHFGEGHLYGLSQMGEYVGIYYNKAKLDDLGLEPPQTWSDFTAALDKAKSAGELPIQFGNLDQWPAIHTFGVIQDQIAGKDYPRNLVFGTGDAAWTDPGTVEAATTLQQWVDRGYFGDSVNGVGYDDSMKHFAAGQGVFMITGTWAAADLKGPMGDSLGLMVPPPGAAGSSGSVATTGGESLAFGVTSKSDHADVAAAYIDFLTNEHAADVMTETGNLPAVPGEAAQQLPEGSIDAQLVEGWQQLSEDNGLVPYLDYSTPTFYDTITAALQSLIGGQASPEEFAQTLQDDYAAFHQE